MNIDEILNESSHLQVVDLSFDLKRMREAGDTMTKDEFSEERFDAVYQGMREQSNAGTLSMSLNFSHGQDLKIIVDEEGIRFENFRSWLAESYASRAPVEIERRARWRSRARRKAYRTCDNPERAEEINLAAKLVFWRHTPRLFVEEVENGS